MPLRMRSATTTVGHTAGMRSQHHHAPLCIQAGEIFPVDLPPQVPQVLVRPNVPQKHCCLRRCRRSDGVHTSLQPPTGVLALTYRPKIETLAPSSTVAPYGNPNPNALFPDFPKANPQAAGPGPSPSLQQRHLQSYTLIARCWLARRRLILRLDEAQSTTP